MHSIHYFDRSSGTIQKEEVYYEGGIRFLYGKSFVSRTLGRIFLHTLAKWPLISWIFGLQQQRPSSKTKIIPFIEKYNLDVNEFADPVESFGCFNDFFIRHLKAECRPIAQAGDATTAIIPADGRYRFYETVEKSTLFSVKGKTFSLETLLQDKIQAKRFAGGSLCLARLCPTDCHRFYFPCNCTPSATQEINGKLFSVNPIAIRDNPWIYCVNRRTVTYLETEAFGTIAFLEIGATSVGSIHQTFTPNTFYKKGSEKGYFSFGGSALVILFEPNRIQFDKDLLTAMNLGLEIRCLIGQSMGTVKPIA